MKNGKLFGKLNVIDILIILIVLVALAFAAWKMLGNDDSEALAGSLDAQSTLITFLAEDTVSPLPDCLAIGDLASEYDSDIDLGKLVSFSTEEAYTYEWDSVSGEVVKVPVVNRVFMTFTVQAEGNLSDAGFTTGGKTFVVGGNYYINIGPARVECRAISMESAE